MFLNHCSDFSEYMLQYIIWAVCLPHYSYSYVKALSSWLIHHALCKIHFNTCHMSVSDKDREYPIDLQHLLAHKQTAFRLCLWLHQTRLWMSLSPSSPCNQHWNWLVLGPTWHSSLLPGKRESQLKKSPPSDRLQGVSAGHSSAC